MQCSRLQFHQWHRSGKDDEAGQALIEVALGVSLLLLLLLGAVEFGRFAYFAIELSNAAKAAAQYGSQNSITAADVAGMQLVASQDAPEVNSACTNFTTTIQQPATCACVVSGASSAASCSATNCAGYIVQYLTVSTSAQCRPMIHADHFTATLTMTGHAVQEVLK
jgi:Flp pilus assembly protein TadG